MYDKSNWNDDNEEHDMHDYGPNTLARLSNSDPEKYRRIVQSNIDYGDTVEDWERRNLEKAQEYLRQQRCR